MQVKIQRLIDKYIFGFLCILFFLLKYIPFKKKKYLKQPKKILVIRFWALGSSLLTFPMIKQLKDFYGNDIEIDLLATNRNLIVFKNQGYFKNSYNVFNLKSLLKFIFRFKKYDIVIDTEEYFRISALLSVWLGKTSIGFGELFSRRLCYNYSIKYDLEHQIVEYLKLLEPLGIKYNIPTKLESLKYIENDKIKVEVFLKNYTGKIKVCMHTAGAETSSDRFWAIGKWKDLIEKTIDYYQDNVIIFLSGTNFEKVQVEKLISILDKKYKDQVVSLVNKINLFEFSYFLENCDLMVSNDTGPMHLSACMGTKTVGLFGPNLPKLFGAWPLDKNINIYKGDGKVYVKVMKGEFEEDKERNIDKIEVEDILVRIKN